MNLLFLLCFLDEVIEPSFAESMRESSAAWPVAAVLCILVVIAAAVLIIRAIKKK